MEMTLEQILREGARAYSGNKILEAHQKDSGINAIPSIIELEGRQKDPKFADLLERSIDMTPARQRLYLQKSVNGYAGVASKAVAENLGVALGGFSNKESLASYLLESPLKPGDFGPSKDWNKTYRAAHSAYQFLKNPEDLGKRIQTYLNGIVRGLSDAKVSGDLVGAVAWVYQFDPELAKRAVLGKAENEMGEFVNGLTIEDGVKYISNRFEKLGEKDKGPEAYRISRAIIEPLIEAKKGGNVIQGNFGSSKGKKAA